MLVFSCCKFNFGKSLSLYILQSKWRQIYTVLLYFPVCVCSSGWLLRPLWSCCWFLWNTLSPMHLSSSRPSTLWTIRKVTNSQYSTNTHTWLLIIMSQLVFLMITSSISMQLRLSLKALHCLRISPNVSSCLKLLFTATPYVWKSHICALQSISPCVCVQAELRPKAWWLLPLHCLQFLTVSKALEPVQPSWAEREWLRRTVFCYLKQKNIRRMWGDGDSVISVHRLGLLSSTLLIGCLLDVQWETAHTTDTALARQL